MSARFGSLEHYHAQGTKKGYGRSGCRPPKPKALPKVPKGKCRCGCGQSDHKTNRQRLLRCDKCWVRCRMSPGAMRDVGGYLICPCGGMIRPECVVDAATAGDTSAAQMLRYQTETTSYYQELGRRGGQASARKRKLRDKRGDNTDDCPF